MPVPVTHEELENTINTRINTVLEPLLPASTPVVYDNEDETPTTDLWIRAHIAHGGNFQADIGGELTRFRRVGIIMFQIFTKLGIGTKDGNQIVEHIEAVFRSKRIDGVTYVVPDVQNLGREDDGQYWQLNVSCPFWVDVF